MDTQTCKVCGVIKPLSEFHYRAERNKHRTDCKECRCKREVSRRYSITVGQLEQMFEEQDSRCAICRTHVDDVPHKSFGNPLVVDHCHTTGSVRGLLCPTCNSGLGHFKDSPQLLLEAAKYLLNKQKENHGPD